MDIEEKPKGYMDIWTQKQKEIIKNVLMAWKWVRQALSIKCLPNDKKRLELRKKRKWK